MERKSRRDGLRGALQLSGFVGCRHRRSAHSANMGYAWISNMWGKFHYSVHDVEIAGGLLGKGSLSHL